MFSFIKEEVRTMKKLVTVLVLALLSILMVRCGEDEFECDDDQVKIDGMCYIRCESDEDCLKLFGVWWTVKVYA